MTLTDLTRQVLDAACQVKHPAVPLEQALTRPGFSEAVAQRIQQTQPTVANIVDNPTKE